MEEIDYNIRKTKEISNFLSKGPISIFDMFKIVTVAQCTCFTILKTLLNKYVSHNPPISLYTHTHTNCDAITKIETVARLFAYKFSYPV